MFCFQNLSHGYINFFEKRAFGNHFDRKYADLVFIVSGFKQKNGKMQEKNISPKFPLYRAAFELHKLISKVPYIRREIRAS